MTDHAGRVTHRVPQLFIGLCNLSTRLKNSAGDNLKYLVTLVPASVVCQCHILAYVSTNLDTYKSCLAKITPKKNTKR